MYMNVKSCMLNRVPRRVFITMGTPHDVQVSVQQRLSQVVALLFAVYVGHLSFHDKGWGAALAKHMPGHLNCVSPKLFSLVDSALFK
ncbi:uncharacterized protein VDAG_07047 [Verticillium dahliae VdLs.17]|uniref:Uncharacterized protein n=1 Tax=Verticillium dahliae (strain VdLs.17 / ATCC MYA-4575 / FGSC 10137) TaxID=498257 RepID=G2XAE4_VERDV|nr:uncharacterized protein VDAG_07047 [Verticillium dahliae VdLs.17]EGY15883.1 hypothetical protein VDAG_07047 [Verticillium dahliae VdLs.17]